jgi:hypothetical protein
MTHPASVYKQKSFAELVSKTPAHCGEWDSYRRRGFNPRYINGNNETIIISDKNSIAYAKYRDSYEWNESLGDFKDYT